MVGMVAPTLTERFDRIAMVLPHGGAPFLCLALDRLKPGGLLHYYAFCNEGEFDLPLAELQDVAVGVGAEIQDADIHKCGHIAPGKYRICIDAVVQ